MVHSLLTLSKAIFSLIFINKGFASFDKFLEQAITPLQRLAKYNNVKYSMSKFVLLTKLGCPQ